MKQIDKRSHHVVFFYTILMTFAFLLLGGTFINHVNADTQTNKPIAVFYSPHQDDELLTMGNAILYYVHQGYEVHVVLITDGTGSSIFNKVNKELEKKYLKPLTKRDFSNARNLEFVRSLGSLGVDRNNIHFARLKDGGTTVEEISDVVLKFRSRFPNAKHMALSFHDDHIDHRNSGLALQTLYNEGLIEEPKFYIQNNERYLWDGIYEPYLSEFDLPIQNAMASYLDWDPLRLMYSIGGISVSGDFDKLTKDPRSKFHGPNE